MFDIVFNVCNNLLSVYFVFNEYVFNILVNILINYNRPNYNLKVLVQYKRTTQYSF